MNNKELAERIAKAETEAENQLVENILSEFERIGIDTSEWEGKFGDGNFAHEFIAAGIQDHLEKLEAMGKPEDEQRRKEAFESLMIDYAWEAWKFAANAFRMYPNQKHTFSDARHYLLDYGRKQFQLERVEAMGVQPGNEQNVQVSDTRNDAQRYTAD